MKMKEFVIYYSIHDAIFLLQLLETDISLQANKLEKHSQEAQKLAEQGHFDTDKIKAETAYITQRYDLILCSFQTFI